MTAKEKAKDTRLRREYNVTLDEKNKTLEYQAHVCYICKRKYNKTGGLLILSTDHRHSDGLVRGWLCWQCNKGVAIFQDNPQWLYNASDYLEHPPFVALYGKRFCAPGKVGTKLRRKRIKKLQETNGINKTRKMGKKQKKL